MNVKNTKKPQKRIDVKDAQRWHLQTYGADNLYPQMSIRLMPWIFGSRSSNVPESIAQLLFASEDYDKLYRHCLEESARLLYVGMTRAAEVLVLVPWFAKKEFDWLRRSGLPAAGDVDNGDVLGVGADFKVVLFEHSDETESEGDDEGEYEVMPEPKACRMLDYLSENPSDAPLRAVAPSGLKGKADDVEVIFRSEESIKVNSAKLHGRAYSEVGDCIHNVYAAIELLEKEDVEQLIRSHGMDDVLPNADEVIRAWDNLQDFLVKEHGKPLAVYHERPFRSLQEDGTVVVGSIDYVYKTADGVVLIDFKTFPQVEAVTDLTSEHFAGLYAGQLDAYTDVLEAVGEKVLKRLIYYPVSGLLVKIGGTTVK